MAPTTKKEEQAEAPQAPAPVKPNQLLDAIKTARKAVATIQEQEAAARKAFRDQQVSLEAVLVQASQTEGLEVLAGNAIASGLTTTSDPATFQAVSEGYVRELAARAHI